MYPAAFPARTFGVTRLPVGPLGLGSSPGLHAAGVERAFERGVSFFLWGSLRRRGFGVGLRNLAQTRRDRMVIAIQTYTRAAWLMQLGVDRALRQLKTDYVDVLTLAWWNGAPPGRIVDEALRLRDAGKVRHLMISSHHRPYFEQAIGGGAFDAIMVRYNAAHPGAEREVFPHLAKRDVGVVSFTATRWGTLLDPKYMAAGERVPSASDCYRFALSNPNVDVALSAPADDAQLDEALLALDRGPLDAQETTWIRRVGAQVRDATATGGGGSTIGRIDRIARALSCEPKQLTT
jgi:aryl-alcohol dehydrogenase-like predicted oxidoreductase